MEAVEVENQALKKKLKAKQVEEEKQVHPNTVCYSC